MKHRLDDIPAFDTRKCRMGAEHFNLVRLALKRLGTPLRLELPGLRTFDLVLEPQAWIVVDRALNDTPILAWLNFDARTDLFSPVACERRSYHTHALVVVDKVLEAMHLLLGERLYQDQLHVDATVVRLHPRSDSGD